MPSSGEVREPVEDAGVRRFIDAMEMPVFVIAERGRLVFANRAWRELFDGGQERWAVLDAVSPTDRSRLRTTLENALASNRRGSVEFTAFTRSGDATMLSCSMNPYKPAGSAESFLICACWDMTDQRRQEERLAFMAGHDPLTGLANRRAFEEALARASSRADRGANAALLLMDMDHLKEFNDSRGHLEGDQALVNLSLLLRRHVRAGDLPARIGGDEFAVLLDDADAGDAHEIAERIRVAASSEEFVAGAREHRLGVSGGIAEVEAGVDSRTLLDRADAALYAAKNRGRDRIVDWSASISALAPAEWLTARVRTAFAEDGFCLLYQPVVRLLDGKVAYFESLVRMRDPEGPLVGPSEFLPVVERLGLMPHLTRRVVELALWELVSAPTASISLNLSSSDVADEELLEEVAGALRGAQAARGRLLFEVSESTLLSNLAGSRAWMDRLGELGCRFVLDRFGTGAGMFSLLREPRIEQVKLSHTVMRAMCGEDGNKAFVKALRELIESQGKLAVAGYLETDDLLHDVMLAGFEWGQGFTLHEPSGDLPMLIRNAHMVATAEGPEGS